MPVKKTGSIATKLTGLVIVIAVVVLCAKSQMAITDQTTDQIQRTHFPITVVPVDRNSLSQQILPAQSNFGFSITNENASTENTSQESKTRAQSYRVGSQSGPSDYELRLDDQKAWGSQPRRASLVSTTIQPARSSEKVTVASTQTPIVPGHEDPHLWLESQHLQLVVDHAGQPKEQPSPAEPIEFTELPPVSPEEPISVLSLLKSLTAEPLLAESSPEKTLPNEAHSVKAVPAPPVRMAQAWETGRY